MTSDKIPLETKFDWGLYVDATFAGLSILIPIPLLDLFFEWFFKRRMPQAIAKRNGRSLDKYTIQYLNQSQWSCWGCLTWPVALVLLFLKRTYRTILYFLTIKDAADNLSFYWHRAFLLDFMVRRGDLDDEDVSKTAALAMHTVLENLTISPLTQLAQQVVSEASHIIRTVWRWLRRHKEDEVVEGARSQMANAWDDFSAYLEEIAERYVETLTQIQIEVTVEVGETAVGETAATETLAAKLVSARKKDTS
jgi:hypothetical protein